VTRSLRLPGDKSISHRALILAALGEGRSVMHGLLTSADVESTASVLRALGAPVPDRLEGACAIDGTGLRGLRAPEVPLDCGNSGTTARLLAGVLAGAGLEATLIGDASLSARPMRRVADPLSAMGAAVALPPHRGLPMRVRGGQLHGITWHQAVPSAQVKSAVLLAGLLGGVPVEVHEPLATRDHTERMLRARGVDVRTEGGVVTLHPAARLDALESTIPGDASSAAFLLAAAALGAAPELALDGVGVNPGRIGGFQVLRRMGATMRFEASGETGGEPVATVVGGPGALRGVVIAPEEVPALIDELPVLACVAARSEGETRVTGAGELRVKESDRIRLVVENLRAIGADAEELPDGFVVRGSDRPLRGTVRTGGDHRIAMAFGVLGAVPGNVVTVDDPSCVGVSWPTFWDVLAHVCR
jgi:3-phosphoshikimate 1-carboxyvinyltransferase